MKRLKTYSLITVGLILTAAGIALCYLPNKIVSGGVSGLSTILYHVFGVAPGLSFAAINLLLLIVAYRILGRAFAFKTVLCALAVSLLVQLFSLLPPLTENVLLASVFGSALYGFGIALTLIGGASTGGTDILGRLLQHFFKHMPIGKLLLVVDASIILTSLFVFREVDLALYGILALFLSTTAIDYLMRRLNLSKLAFVVTDKGEEMAHYLTNISPRGVTLLSVRGGYTGDEKFMLVCALKSHEMPRFEESVREIDPKAFTMFSESTQILGNGFAVYR